MDDRRGQYLRVLDDKLLQHVQGLNALILQYKATLLIKQSTLLYKVAVCFGLRISRRQANCNIYMEDILQIVVVFARC
jgi:hypothetical protein